MRKNFLVVAGLLAFVALAQAGEVVIERDVPVTMRDGAGRRERSVLPVILANLKFKPERIVLEAQ